MTPRTAATSGARPAVAYLRRSVARTDDPGTVSREAQLDAVRDVASRHGDDPDQLVILADWGVSGRQTSIRKREAYAQLETMVAAGTVGTVYAYNLSRLGRSTEQLSRFARLCREHGVAIRCANGLSPDISDATGRLMLNVLTAFDEYLADWAAERSADAIAVRVERGDVLGRQSFVDVFDAETVAAVVDAVRDAGNMNGAAKLLNERGVPTWSQRHFKDRTTAKPWSSRSVLQVVERAAPEMVPAHRPRGTRPRSAHRLAGLLTCHCGRTLTPMMRSNGPAYYCYAAHHVTAEMHARPYVVAESRLMPWLVDEAARLRVPATLTAVVEANEAAVERATERKRRLGIAFADGAVDEPTYRTRLADLDAELAKAGAVTRVLAVPQAVPWSAEPAALNAVLRALWSSVQLGPDLMPVAAEWRVPEWRDPR